MLAYAGARDGAEAEGDDLPDVLLQPPGISKAITKAIKASSKASSKAREGVGQKLKLMIYETDDILEQMCTRQPAG